MSVRSRRPLGSVLQSLALTVCIGASTVAAKADSQSSSATKTVHGGTQQNILNGAANTDSLRGGTTSTLLNGNVKSTALSGNAKQTLLNGAVKADAISGNANQSLLNGTAKSDSLSGGARSNLLNGAAQSDSLSGGARSTLINGSARSDALSGGAKSTLLNGSAKSDLLNGAANQTLLNGNASATQPRVPLQGGIKDEATLRSSLRLLKPATDKGAPLLTPGIINSTFMPGSVTQYSGHTSSGPLAPVFQPQNPTNAVYRPQSGVIPPLSTYTLTRNNSRTWVAPGYEVTPANISRSTAVVPPSSTSSTSFNQRGVTVWAPGFDVTSISQVVGSGALASMAGNVPGVAVFMPQYAVHKVTVSTPPTSYDPPITSQKGVTSYKPGYEVTVTSTNHGVVTWTPGYQLSTLVPGAMRETLSGVWHTGAPKTPLLASQGVLPQPQFTKILVPEQSPLVATTLLLPQLRAQAQEKISWDEWYKRVARAIYCRWQYAEVGPGTATIRMVVTKDRDVQCQLIDFKPAPDVKRDVAAETNFRESAVKAVNMVTKFEIPDLPSPLEGNKVVFDLDLKRTVDGPTGVDVASDHR